MELPNILLTKEDFDKARWEEVINSSEKKECFNYSDLFRKKAEEAKKAGNIKDEAIFILLAAITSFYLRPESAEKPFIPMFQFHDSRGLILDDLNQENLNSLKELSITSDPEIRARVADVLWIRCKDYTIAELAIDAYLESATILEDPKRWPASAERIERALRLALFLRNQSQISKVAGYIEKIIKKYNGTDPSFFSAKMMELLLEIKKGSPQDYIGISERLAKQGEKEHNWHKARTYWNIKARWHFLADDIENQKASLLQEAETYVRESEYAIQSSKPSFFAASIHLQKAIEAFRRLGGNQEKVQELHKKLLGYQKKTIAEMHDLSIKMDPDLSNRLIENSKNKVKNKTFQEAIRTLALMCRSPKVVDLRKRVKSSIEKHPMLFLVSNIGVNQDGKIIARRPPAQMGSSEGNEAAIRAEMYSQAATIDIAINTQTIIEPARQQIALEYRGTVADFLSITSNNAFVPPGREFLYARGMSAGLRGDFVEFANIIMPQIENSIRYLLFQRGIPTSSLDSEGIQNEYDLNKLLYLSEVKTIFGEDITFDLQGLLVVHSGTNLRNRQAHGLLDLDDFFSVSVSYAWWLVLRILFLIIIATEREEKPKVETKEEKKP